MRAAETAIQILNGRRIFDSEIRVNWAHQGQQDKEDTSTHYHIFVGDLAPEVNDTMLTKAFLAFGGEQSLSEARVMWDMMTGKSRGYGFVSFRNETDAEQAIATMNGEYLGNRQIRVSRAQQRQGGITSGGASYQGPPGATTTPNSAAGAAYNQSVQLAKINQSYNLGPALPYETVLEQTPKYHSTIYVGNLDAITKESDLIPLFQSFGYDFIPCAIRNF